MNRQEYGWILLLIGLTPGITFYFIKTPQYFGWFSNHTLIITGLAVLAGSRFWVFAQLCIGLLPELLWSIDFLSKPILGEHIWGFTAYMFKNGVFDMSNLYSIQHLLFFPAVLYALYLVGGPVRQAYLGSFIHLTALIPISLAWGPKYNLNCVFESCGLLKDVPEYFLIRTLTMIVMVFLVYWVVMFLWKE